MFTFYQFTSIQSPQNFSDLDACLPFTCLPQSKVPKFSGPLLHLYLLLSQISELKKWHGMKYFLNDACLPFTSLPLYKVPKTFQILMHVYLLPVYLKAKSQNFQILYSMFTLYLLLSQINELKNLTWNKIIP